MRGILRAIVGFGSALALWLAPLAQGAVASPLPDQGGPVVHSNTVRLVFWNPAGLGLAWDSGYRELITRFIGDVAADAGKPTNPYSLTPQYANASGPLPYNTVYGGAYDDLDAAPASDCLPPSGWAICLKGGHLSTELRTFVASHALPTGPEQVYLLVTPHGLASCNRAGTKCLSKGYCAYHTYSFARGGTRGDASTLLWADIPYSAGICRTSWPRPNASTADTVISSISHEHIEILTDPYANAWRDAGGNEVGDRCESFQGHHLNGSSGPRAYNTVINGHPYNIQGEWSNADDSCQMNEGPVANLRVSTPAPRRVSGAVIAFDGSQSRDPDGRVAAYAWGFGDGSATASGAATRHVYARGGAYSVRLIVTDSAGFTDSIVYRLTIAVAARITSAHTLSRGRQRWLVLRASGPGVVVVNGHHFRILGASRIRFRAPLTAQQARRLRRHRRISLKIRFVPRIGGTQTLSLSVH